MTSRPVRERLVDHRDQVGAAASVRARSSSPRGSGAARTRNGGRPRPSRRTRRARPRRTSVGAGRSSRRTARRPAELDQFVGGREHARRVGEAAAHPDRALLAGPGRAAASSRPARPGWPGGSAVPTTIIRSVPCGTRYAALQAIPWSSRSRYPATVDQLKSKSSGSPFQPAIWRRTRGPGRVVDRGERQTVLAEHLQRDALADLRGVVRVRQDLQVGVRVHVDEAGRQAPARPRRSSAAPPARSLPTATIRAAVDGHVGDERRERRNRPGRWPP